MDPLPLNGCTFRIHGAHLILTQTHQIKQVLTDWLGSECDRYYAFVHWNIWRHTGTPEYTFNGVTLVWSIWKLLSRQRYFLDLVAAKCSTFTNMLTPFGSCSIADTRLTNRDYLFIQSLKYPCNYRYYPWEWWWLGIADTIVTKHEHKLGQQCLNSWQWVHLQRQNICQFIFICSILEIGPLMWDDVHTRNAIMSSFFIHQFSLV